MTGKDTGDSSKHCHLSKWINLQGKIIYVYAKKKMTQHTALRNPKFKNLPTRTKYRGVTVLDTAVGFTWIRLR